MNHFRTIAQILKQIFPIGVIVLAIYTTIIGLFLNPNEIEFRQLYILLFWIPIFTIPAILLKRRLPYYFLCILLFIVGFVDIGFWALTNAPVNDIHLFIFLNTHLSEAAGFTNTNFNWKFLLFIPYIIFFIFTLKRVPTDFLVQNKTSKIFIYSIGIIVLLFFGRKIQQGLFVSYATPQLVESTSEFFKINKKYRALTNTERLDSQKGISKAFSSENKQITVMIFGESVSKNHMSLYGYPRNTTPLLENNKEIFVFENVISGYPNTLEALTHALTEANIDNQQIPPESITSAEIFRGAGYKTYWLSNQESIGLVVNQLTMLAEQYDESYFAKIKNRNSFDSELLEALQNILKTEEDKKFIVLHLHGTHIEYKDRYPEEFNVFTDGKTEKEKVLDHYHNAILYQDFIVDSLIKTVEKYCIDENAIGSVLYASDHGESIYECGNEYLGHSYIDSKIPKCMVEIPFLVWLSPQYKKSLNEKYKTIKNNTDLPFMTDDIYHTLIDLAGISHPSFQAERSVFHLNFDKSRKRIMNDGVNYDE